MVRITYSFIVKILYSGKCTSGINLILSFCRMKEDFMEVYLVREQFQSDTCLVRYSRLMVYPFLSICKMRIIHGAIIGKKIKICRDQEYASLMLYCTKVKILGMLFISCRSDTSRIQLYKYKCSNQMFMVLPLFKNI